MPTTIPELSIVIPVCNEYDVLPKMIERTLGVIESVTENYEIIIVDDGSIDGTFELVKQAHVKNTRIKGVRLSRRFGKESALYAGLTRVTGQATITIDGDLQHPPELIPQMVMGWRQGAQIVHGVKNKNHFMPLTYRLASRLFYKLLSYVVGFDMQGSSDYKLLDARVVKYLVDNFHERQRFFRGLVTTMGFSQQQIAFDVKPRGGGRSRWSTWQLAQYSWRIVSAFTSLPLYLIPVMGIVMLIFAILLGGEAIVSWWNGNSVSGFATLEITLLFIGSMVMVGLGIVGQYLARIYDEIKQRPIFLIEREIGF